MGCRQAPPPARAHANGGGLPICNGLEGGLDSGVQCDEDVRAAANTPARNIAKPVMKRGSLSHESLNGKNR